MQQNNNDKKPGLSWSTPATSNTNDKNTSPKSPTLPMTPATSNSMARYAGIFVGGLIVGVVLAWGWSAMTNKSGAVATNGTSTVAATKATSTTSGKTTATSKPTTSSNTSVAGGVVLQSSELTLAPTQQAGQSVKIDNVVVSKPTWVIVYDNNDGKPGNVLGAQLFFSTGSGTVTLLRSTMAGKMYFVGRAIDNGDRKFQKATDKAVMDESGNPVLATFTAK